MMGDMQWATSLQVLSVDLLLAAGALLVMLVDLILPHGRKRITGWLALVMVVQAFVATFVLDLHGSALFGAYVGDPLAVVFKQIFLLAAFIAILGSLTHVDRVASRRQGEYYALILFSLTGMSLLAGTRNLILLLVAFELMGLPLYILAAWAKTGPEIGGSRGGRKLWTRPSEAAFKLFVVGAASSAITGYGLSLIYGSSGTTSLAALASTPQTPLLLLGLMMMIAGFGFKIGAVPFHMWVPDTYEGASTPFVAFLSVAPKAAGLVALTQLLLGGFLPLYAQWVTVVLVLVVASLSVGNLMAIPQRNVKRLLGYSGIAQIAFPTMALLAVSPELVKAGQAQGLSALLFFIAGYTVANMGLFLVVEAVAASKKTNADGTLPLDDFDGFAGLSSRSPWLAAAALIFLLSLAGIPFVVGFWAKFYVLMAVWQAGFSWLVVFAAAVSVLGLFYYLGLARAIYMGQPAGDSAPIKASPTLAAAILFCLVATIGAGVYPAPLIEAAQTAASAFFGG